MVVNFEFLGNEPIENVITCMNFKVDKVVYFGYHETIEKQRTKTEEFLKEICGVKKVVFHSLSKNDLLSTINTMRKEIQRERENNNRIFFDVTGGESMILVAFGVLSKEFDTPMHVYDVAKDKLIELEDGASTKISESLETCKIPMSLDTFVKMHGGIINKKLQKSIKGINDTDFMDDVEKIYKIAKQNWYVWNPFSDFLKNTMVPVNNLQVSKKAHIVLNALSESKNNLKTAKKLNELLDALENEGLLKNVVHANGVYKYEYKNRQVKECLWEGGSVLELHTCQAESRYSDECQVGVHIDWDGVIHSQKGIDVLNEIDVLSMRGNAPVFISCKSGNLNGKNALHALYELETVAQRFGGKYAKKILVTSRGLKDAYMNRAKEMGIEVR